MQTVRFLVPTAIQRPSSDELIALQRQVCGPSGDRICANVPRWHDRQISPIWKARTTLPAWIIASIELTFLVNGIWVNGWCFHAANSEMSHECDAVKLTMGQWPEIDKCAVDAWTRRLGGLRRSSQLVTPRPENRVSAIIRAARVSSSDTQSNHPKLTSSSGITSSR